MGQKVWVINDEDLLRPAGVRRVEAQMSVPERRPEPVEAESRAVGPKQGKSPAVAFSLGLLCWGGGHLYLGQKRRGYLGLAAMSLWYVLLGTVFRFGTSLVGLTAERAWLAEVLPGVVAVLLPAGLLLWLVSAVEAYCRAAKTRSATFFGVDRGWWPPLASLAFPGWGQFLNGQPKKGSLFLLAAMTGLVAVLTLLAARIAWPLVTAGGIRPELEAGLVAMLLYLPVALLVWLVGVYDAFRGHRQQVRRKLSVQNPAYRAGRRGLLRACVPRLSAVLGLLLAVSVAMQAVPRQYYLDSLEDVRLAMLAHHLELMPRLLEQALEAVEG